MRNLSKPAARMLRTFELTALDLFHHVAGLLHAPAYRDENIGALRMDWPRIPLPNDRDRFAASAALGRQVVALLDGETGVAGVTEGAVRPELRVVGVLRQSGEEPLDLEINARWGIAGQRGVTMPSRGDARERAYDQAERAALTSGAAALGLAPDQALALLGETCFDVHLNETTFWACLPARVWRATIGGYQVLKKWLSYREFALLGRALGPDEARHVSEVARRLAALRLLEPTLDANARACADTAAPWPPPGAAP